ncbi:MAG: PilZ domain-containing protein [Pirellulales bacterium]
MSMRNRRINRRLFTDCVANNRGAFVMFPELDAFCPANFVQMHRDSLEFQLPTETVKGIHKASVCCVTFQDKSMLHVFLSLIINFRKLSQFDLARLTVATPRRVRRSALRVRVPENSGLVVRVTADGGFLWAPRAVNLSIDGVLLDFGKNDAPNLPVGIRLDVVMMLGTDAVTLNAEVSRRDGHQYGLKFRNVYAGSDLKPPSVLRRIVQRLERQCVQETYCAETQGSVLSESYWGDPTANGSADPFATMVGATSIDTTQDY